MQAPEPVIKIWKSSTVYYEVEDVVTLPVIDRQENRAGSFTFSVTYDATDDTILDSTFDGWSDSSTGAVDWGLRVTIDNVANNVTTRVAEGIITTITPTETLLSFECADMLSVLSAKGAELHRNYYNSATYTGWFDAITGGSEGDNTVAVDISAISNAGGTPVDPISYKVKRTQSWSYNKVYDMDFDEGHYRLYWEFTAASPFYQIALTFNEHAAGISYRLIKNYSTLYENNRSFTEGWATNILPGNVIYSAGTYLLEIMITNSSFDTAIRGYSGSASDGAIKYGTYGATLLEYGSLASSITYYDEKTVTAWSRNGNQLLITGISGATIDSSTKPDLIDPSSNRANIPYTAGSIQTTEIMEHVKKVALDDDVSASIDTSAFGSAPTLALFRTGGGYALDYLQKLADVATSSGRQLAFCMDNNVIRIGARRMPTDAASYSVVGGSLDGPLYLMSLDLKKTMKGRPSRAMLRGSLSSDSNNKPIMAVLRNMALANRRNGILTDTVITDSSALTASDMIAQAYASVNSSSEDWEGTLVLSGIVPDLIDSSGAYAGSGKVISITDVHQGITAKSFKVTAVKLDYVKLTTTVTLTNAKQIYSSDIAESIAEALTVGDMAVAMSGSDLYKTQFCYQYSSNSETTLTSGNVVKIKTTDNVEYTLGDVAIYSLPNGRKLIYGAVTISGSSSNAKYRVAYYQINGGTWRTIPARDRCDAYNGQYVILNVDCPQ